MCGITGIINQGNDQVFGDLYRGMHAIQHRGQDAAGILTFSNRFHLVKGRGLVRDVFGADDARVLTGNMGIGHVRYPTTGKGSWEDVQPFWTSTPYGIGMAHNGNLTNFHSLKEHFRKVYRSHINSDCDVEGLLCLLGDELLNQNGESLKPGNVFDAIEGVFNRANGAYSVIGMIAGRGMFAFRDPHGIKPLIMGFRRGASGKSCCFASESVVIDMLDYHDTSDLSPGEAVFIEPDCTVHRKVISPKLHTPCIFEWVYFARPDSFIDKVSVYKTRKRLGEKLARSWKQSAPPVDVVVPVPESATTAALSMANALDVPYREALVKNRYIGRTFIMPRDSNRPDSVRMKLNPIQIEFEGKDVLLLDDSIVRGNTSKNIIAIARKAGAKKVHMASYSPPLEHPCVYGIDMSTNKEFVARGKDVDGIARTIGADHLLYQEIDDLEAAATEGNPDVKNFCTACFTGEYPTGDVTPDLLRRIEAEREA